MMSAPGIPFPDTSPKIMQRLSSSIWRAGRPTLAQLVRRLLARVPALPRLRLSSLDPAEVDDALSELGLAPRIRGEQVPPPLWLGLGERLGEP